MSEAVKKASAGSKKEDRVFKLLLIHIGFQLLNSDSQSAIELLDDLHVCYEKAKNPPKKAKKSKVLGKLTFKKNRVDRLNLSGTKKTIWKRKKKLKMQKSF